MPRGGDDEDLAHAERAGTARRVGRVLRRDAGLLVAVERDGRALPGPAHELGLGGAVRPTGPAAEEDGVALSCEPGGVGDPRGADRMEPVLAAVRVAEDDEQPRRTGLRP
jgi:hypothetical protein